METSNTIPIKARGYTLLKYIAPAVIAIGMAVLYRYNPSASSFYPPCIFKRLTGLNCPGCGSARAGYQLLHGHLYAAIDYNILMVILLPVIVWGCVVQLTGRGLQAWNRMRPLPLLLLVCLFWILRNIDLHPLTWLNADK